MQHRRQQQRERENTPTTPTLIRMCKTRQDETEPNTQLHESQAQRSQYKEARGQQMVDRNRRRAITRRSDIT
jgi:hypothetical protein